MTFFEKGIGQINQADIEWLIRSEVREGTEIEYKRSLATSDGSDDRWVTHGDRIGDAAKNDIVKELLGFTSVLGGSLVLGMDETKEKPSRAKAIVPLPNAADLADRLKMACRDLAEPALPSLEVASVPIGLDGKGVVVLRVPNRSLIGPHRHKRTKEFYVRRNDETLPMDIYELRRHMVELDRRIADSEAMLRSGRQDLIASFGSSPTSRGPRFAAQFHALPAVPMSISHIHRLSTARPNFTRVSVRCTPQGQEHQVLVPRAENLIWRPIFRGTRGLASRENGASLAVNVSADGVVRLEMSRDSDTTAPALYLSWLVGLFANGLLAIERIRQAANAPSLEFGIAFTLLAYAQAHSLRDYNASSHDDAIGVIQPGFYFEPPTRYAALNSGTFSDLTAIFEGDLINLAGADYPGRASCFDYSSALEK